MGWRGGRQYVSILVVNALAVLVVVDVPQSMGYRTALDERTSLDVLFEEHVKRYLPSYTLNQTEMAFRRQVFAVRFSSFQTFTLPSHEYFVVLDVSMIYHELKGLYFFTVFFLL